MNPFEKAALFVLLLASLVFVHELGHFLVAKLFKVKVLRFSLGFGPKLLSFTWGETEYRVSALPLGGYVKMAGDDPTEELSEADRGRGFLEQAPWKRSLIALAGPVMNLAFPVFVYFAAFYSQDTALSTRLGRVEPDRPAWAAGLRPGDKILAIDGEPVRFFDEVRERVAPRFDQKLSITYERAGKVTTVELQPERTEETNALGTEVRGVIGIAPVANAPLVGVADPASPAARAGLQSFDRVVSVDGAPVKTYAELEQKLAAAGGPVQLAVEREPEPDGVKTVKAKVPAEPKRFEARVEPGAGEGAARFGIEPTDLYVFRVEEGSPAWQAGVRRGDRMLEVSGQTLRGWAALDRARQATPDKPVRIAFLHAGERVERDVLQRRIDQDDGFGNQVPVLQFGAQRDIRDSSFVDGELIPFDIGAGEALRRAVEVIPEEVGKTALAIAGLFTGQLSFKSVGGPVMMYDIAVRSAEMGSEYFLRVMGFISINLGLMNLLPIPVLDGFHILSSGFESIRRRPLSIKARAVANYIGLALLLSLMLIAFKNDFVRYFLN